MQPHTIGHSSKCVAPCQRELPLRQDDSARESGQLTVSAGEVRLDPRRLRSPDAAERAATATRGTELAVGADLRRWVVARRQRSRLRAGPDLPSESSSGSGVATATAAVRIRSKLSLSRRTSKGPPWSRGCEGPLHGCMACGRTCGVSQERDTPEPHAVL